MRPVLAVIGAFRLASERTVAVGRSGALRQNSAVYTKSIKTFYFSKEGLFCNNFLFFLVL